MTYIQVMYSFGHTEKVRRIVANCGMKIGIENVRDEKIRQIVNSVNWRD